MRDDKDFWVLSALETAVSKAGIIVKPCYLVNYCPYRCLCVPTTMSRRWVDDLLGSSRWFIYYCPQN